MSKLETLKFPEISKCYNFFVFWPIRNVRPFLESADYAAFNDAHAVKIEDANERLNPTNVKIKQFARIPTRKYFTTNYCTRAIRLKPRFLSSLSYYKLISGLRAFRTEAAALPSSRISKLL